MDTEKGLEKGEEISFKIPEILIREFGKELRIVIRPPRIICIPVLDLMKQGFLKELKGFEIMIIPK